MINYGRRYRMYNFDRETLKEYKASLRKGARPVLTPYQKNATKTQVIML